MDVSLFKQPTSPLPKSFASTFEYKQQRFLTIGSGSRLNTSRVEDIVGLQGRIDFSSSLHSIALFAELNVFPLVPRIIQGIVYLEKTELVIVWAEDCLVMIPVDDVIRGGDVCPGGVISTQRYVLLATEINQNTIRVFFSNGSVDDVRFESSPADEISRRSIKYTTVNRRIATFEKGRFRSLCNCLQDGKSIGVNMYSSAGEIIEIPVKNKRMPSINIPVHAKTGPFLEMQTLFDQDGFLALLPGYIFTSLLRENRREDWQANIKLSCFQHVDKTTILAGSQRGYLIIYSIDYEKQQLHLLAEKFVNSFGGIKFITKIDDNYVVVGDHSGNIQFFDWRALFGFNMNMGANILPATPEQHVRSVAWSHQHMFMIQGDTLKDLFTYKSPSTKNVERKERILLRDTKLRMVRAMTFNGESRVITNAVYGRKNFFIRTGFQTNNREPATEWEQKFGMKKPIRAVVLSLPSYAICQTTDSIIVYDTCDVRESVRTISKMCQLKMPANDITGRRIDDIITSAVVLDVLNILTPGKLRLLVGTQTGMILYARIPDEVTGLTYPLVVHSSSPSTGGSAVVKMLSYHTHVKLFTRDASIIHMNVTNMNGNNDGISVRNIRTLDREIGRVVDAIDFLGEQLIISYSHHNLIVTSALEMTEILRVPAETRRDYCSSSLRQQPKGTQYEALLYFTGRGKAWCAVATIPKPIRLMAGHGGGRITASLAVAPRRHSEQQSTILVTGSEHGDIRLYKMAGDVCQPWMQMLKTAARITAMTSFYCRGNNKENFAVAVGGANGQITIFTINSMVPSIRYHGPQCHAAGVVFLQFVQHSAHQLYLVAILDDSTTQIYTVTSKIRSNLLNDNAPSYDLELNRTTSVASGYGPINSACLLPLDLMPAGDLSTYCHFCEAIKTKHPIMFTPMFGSTDGCRIAQNVNEFMPQLPDTPVDSNQNSRSYLVRLLQTPISDQLCISINGTFDGSLYVYAYCDMGKGTVFGHMDRCHNSDIIAIDLSHIQIEQNFYLFISSLDQCGLVVVRQMLVTNQNIEYDVQPIRKYSCIRKATHLMVVPEKKHAIVTGEAIEVISLTY